MGSLICFVALSVIGVLVVWWDGRGCCEVWDDDDDVGCCSYSCGRGLVMDLKELKG